MKHALLLNPFNLSQEAGAPVPPRAANRQASRSTPVCSACGNDDIITQATAQWSNESQEWVLASTFGRPAHCNQCNGACEINWLPIR